MPPRPRLSAVPTVAVPVHEQRRIRLRGSIREADAIVCRCGSREILEVRTGAALQGDRVTGGSARWLCLPCLLRGDRVVLA